MEPASSSAGGSGSGSAGLGTRSGTKKKRVESVYSRGASYKKPKKPDVETGLVESSAGPLSLGDLGIDGVKPIRSWGSEVAGETSSVSEISDVENMKNTIAEETSYADSDASEMDDALDDATPRKTRTRTYVLGGQPKKISFDNPSDDDDDILTLPDPKFSGSKRLPPSESRALEKRSFNSAKSFASTLSKFPGRKINSRTNWEVIVKEIPVDLPKLAVKSVFFKFGKIVSIKMQFIGLWQKALVEFESADVADLVLTEWSVLMEKDFVHVVKAVNKISIRLCCIFYELALLLIIFLIC
ncbi:hypothetical protein G9A89_001902 [Geosiphon pyriformis]|nr:hypothetical protein G9A89_001902 [Geosiphon pyriformis]